MCNRNKLAGHKKKLSPYKLQTFTKTKIFKTDLLDHASYYAIKTNPLYTITKALELFLSRSPVISYYKI